MRRFLNFCLVLVLLASVGFVLYKAKILPFARSNSGLASTPTPAPVVSRDSLRISVSHRPEALLVSALKRLLEAENRTIEVVPFDPESSWLELAAGELDLVIAPVGEAVTAQARFQAGKFLFASGMSEGYDLVLAAPALQGAPTSLGISGSEGSELFAISKFPEARLVAADDPKQLQGWLSEGAIGAAVLQSASLPPELSQSAKRLSATSAQSPMPTVVVLSRALSEEGTGNATRIEVLRHALDSWNGLIGYLANQPELLRSTLKQEADEMGVDLDTLLKDYRFLTPNQGRDALLTGYQDGALKQTFDLLVLARVGNLSAPDWNSVLELPVYLQSVLPGGEQAATPPTPSATPQAVASGSPTPGALTPTPSAPSTGGDSGTHHYAGAAPADPWPEPLKMKKVAKSLSYPPALAGSLVGVATEGGFQAYGIDGKQVFQSAQGGAPIAAPVGDDGLFYLMTAGTLSALDAKGKAAWSYTFEGTPGDTLVLTPGEVVFTLETSGGYQIVAVSRQSGEVTWQDALSNPPASAPVVAGTTQPAVLLIDEEGTLRAWNARTGSGLWQASVGKPTFLAPAALGDALALSFPEGGVRLLSLADGSSLWEADLGTSLTSGPTLTETLVLIPAQDKTLYALDRTNGEIQGKARLAAPLSTPAVVVDDHVYCADDSGKVHSLGLPGLELKWSKPLAPQGVGLNGPVFSSDLWALLADDGTLLAYPR